MLRTLLLPSAQGVAAGSTATFNLDIGSREHVIWLKFENTAANLTVADLTGDIRVKINGNIQRIFTPSQASAIYGLYGADYAAQSFTDSTTTFTGVYLPIWLAEPWRKVNPEVDLTAWNIDPKSVTSFQIEVDLPTGITPTLSGFHEVDALTGVLGGIVKWVRQDLPAVGTKQDFNTLDRKQFINAIHLWPAGTSFVKNLKFTANGSLVRDLITYQDNAAQLKGRELVPDTSATPRFDLVFDYDDPINNALLAEGLNEMTLHVEYNAAAAGNMTAIVERTGPPA